MVYRNANLRTTPMSSPDREKERAALERFNKFCKRQNEIADEQAKRHAKIEWIKREIEKLDDSRITRIIILIKQIKE